MRSLIQFLVPALILVVVVYLLGRTRRGNSGSSDQAADSDTGTFVLILVVGAVVAVLSFFVMQAILA